MHIPVYLKMWVPPPPQGGMNIFILLPIFSFHISKSYQNCWGIISAVHCIHPLSVWLFNMNCCRKSSSINCEDVQFHGKGCIITESTKNASNMLTIIPRNSLLNRRWTIWEFGITAKVDIRMYHKINTGRDFEPFGIIRD